MKRLFGVKKTVEAPTLEETTGKVIILSSSRLLLCLLLLFSFVKIIQSSFIESNKTKQIELTFRSLFFSLIINKSWTLAHSQSTKRSN